MLFRSTLETEEGSAYGAALLALVGTGEYTSINELCNVAVRETASVEPRVAEQQVYANGHRVYQELYPATKVLSS